MESTKAPTNPRRATTPYLIKLTKIQNENNNNNNSKIIN